MACSVLDQSGEYFAILSGWWDMIGGGVACFVAGDFLLNFPQGERPPESVLAAARRWHGSIRDKFTNLDNLLRVLAAHKDWPYPATLVALLTTIRDRLQVLILLCEANQATGAERDERNQLLKQMVDICTKPMKLWALNLCVTAVISLDELHSLAYLLPSERGGRHERAGETIARAEVKPDAIDADHVRITVDHSFAENAGQVASGWPGDAKFVLVVIMAADGVTEVFRTISSQLHNNIRMPEGSHGKIFIAKAAFLRHPDDEPHFGNEPTFSMPWTTEDLARGKS
jgi:hypothetical protein